MQLPVLVGFTVTVAVAQLVPLPSKQAVRVNWPPAARLPPSAAYSSRLRLLVTARWMVVSAALSSTAPLWLSVTPSTHCVLLVVSQMLPPELLWSFSEV